MKRIKKITICMLAVPFLFIFLKDKNTTQASCTPGCNRVCKPTYQLVETLNVPDGTNRLYVVRRTRNRVTIYPMNYNLYQLRQGLLRFNKMAAGKNAYPETSITTASLKNEAYRQVVSNAGFINGFPMMFIKQ